MTSNLADVLLQANWLDHNQHQQLLTSPKSQLETLLAQGWYPAKDICQFLSQLFDMNTVQLSEFDYLAVHQKLELPPLWARFQALPIAYDGKRLTVALGDPTNRELEQELRFYTELDLLFVLSNGDDLLDALATLNRRSMAIADSRADYSRPANANTRAEEAEKTSPSDDSVSEYIERIVFAAAEKKASDIHFEPNETGYRIRMRIDGLLTAIPNPPSALCQRLAGRLKVLANLDIAERRLPQDGRTQLVSQDASTLDIRVSTLPTIWGEKIVLRLVDKRAATLDISQLGLSMAQQQSYLNALNKPQGLILVTGPTGSGKTVTLYSGLNQINHEQINIASAEDPVEIRLPGINQVEVKPQIGFDFAHALRAFLRQDPDVIMIGEIRDHETADIAVKAAQTGHLVLATLHTNSAAQSVTRLMQMGIEPYNIANSLSLIIAQRLVRKLCPHCKNLTTSTAPPTASHASFFSANPTGCKHCHQGYSGRTGIYELMPFDSHLADALLNRASASELEQVAQRHGMQTLQQAGVEKWTQGLTSQAELERVMLT